MKKILVLLGTLICVLLTGCGNTAYEKALKHIDKEEYVEAYEQIDKITDKEEKETIALLLNCIFINKAGDGTEILGNYALHSVEMVKQPNNYNKDKETLEMEDALDSLMKLQKEMPLEILSNDLADTYNNYFDVCADCKLCLTELYSVIYSGRGFSQGNVDRINKIVTDMSEVAVNLTRIEQKYSVGDLPEELRSRYNLGK